MTENEIKDIPKSVFIRSFLSIILGTMLLRAAAEAMGVNIQFYLNQIHDAAIHPNSPLRSIVGANHVYPVSYTVGAFIIASFFITELTGSLFFGSLSDRFGRKLFIVLGPLLGAIAVQITAMTTIIWLLVFTRLLEGLSTATNAPATLGYIAEYSSHSEKFRTRIVGFFEIATIGGGALGFMLGGWLWHLFGYPKVIQGITLTSVAFSVNAVIYLASLVIYWVGVYERRKAHPKQGDSPSGKETLKKYWQIVKTPRVASFAPAWIAINGVQGVLLILTARVLTDQSKRSQQLLSGHFNSVQAGYILAGLAVTFVIGILLWSFLAGNLKKIKAMMIGNGGLFVACIALFAINHQPSLNSPLILPFAILLILSVMVLSGFTPSALAHLANITEFHKTDRGAIMGLYSIFLGVGQLLGAGVGGPLVDWLAADGMILAIALFGLMSTVFLLLMWRVEKKAVD